MDRQEALELAMDQLGDQLKCAGAITTPNILFPDICKTTFGDTAGKGHLATFKTRTNAAART